MHATGTVATAHWWSRITRAPAMKLGGSVFRHTKQHVSDMTDGSDTTVWHCRMLEMGACRGTYESAVSGVVDGFKARSGN